MTKIAIVGASTRECSFSRLLEYKIKQEIKLILNSFDNPILVSGGCHLGGIDIFGEDVADVMEIDKRIFLPAVRCWEGYKERNIKIAKYADVLYDFEPKGRSHGGGMWTKDYMLRLGKPAKIIFF